MQNADQATGGPVLHTALVLHCSDITKMKVAIMIINYGNTIKGKVGVADFYLPLNIANYIIQDSICNDCSVRLFDVMFGKFDPYRDCNEVLSIFRIL
jgi:hypothetical protein